MRDPALRQSKILIVDNEDYVVELLRHVLDQDGYREIQSTTDPFAAVRLFREFQPDLVILDLLMPGWSGLEVLAQLRAIIPPKTHLPILMVTADPTIEKRREALARGATDFLTKPYDATEILARVGNLLETRLLHLQLAARNAELMNEAAHRREAEAALQRERDDLRDFFDNAPTGLQWIGEDGRVIWANRAMLDLGGYAREEYVGRAVSEFHVDAEALADIFRRLLNKETLIDHEARLRCKNGSFRHVLINSNGVWRDGKFVHARCFTRDITDRKASEEALRESEELFRQMAETIDDVFWLNSPITCATLYVSPAYERVWGAPAEELLKNPKRRVQSIHSEDRERVIAAFDELRLGARFEEEYRILRPDGTTRWVKDRGFPVRDAAGKICRLVGLAEDITERRSAEDQLQRFFTLSADLLVTVGFDGYFKELNPALEATLGWTEEELKSRPLIEFVHPDDRDEVTAEIGRLARGRETLNFETRYTCKDGGYKLTSWNAKADPFLQLIYGIGRDIKQQREIEKALICAKEEAERANAAKSEFLSRMSHELRTPLNAILGFGQLLETEGRDPEEADNIEQILKAGRHLLGLINEVLDISRIESGGLALSLEPVLVCEAFDEALTLVRPTAARREVTLGECACDRHVLADQQRLKQIFLNLLSNAIKYNRPGGSVTITATETVPGTLRLAVRDTGLGIAPEDLGKVFTPFERLGVSDLKIEGIGLGLGISKRLVELMGGAIGVESVHGEGSTFWIEMPLAESPLAGVGNEVSRDKPKPAATPVCKVLYIEDNLSNLKLIERVLARRPGIKLLAAMQGKLGFELAREHQPDLILLDLHLPDIQGDKVLEQIKNDPRTAGIPVVMLSADATPGQIERLKAAGARDYLTKPLDLKQFFAVLNETLGSNAGG